jgi:hypothetical protein
MTERPTAKRVASRRKVRRKGRSPASEFGSHVIAIDDWDWSFSFGVSQTRFDFDEGPYSDYRHLHLRGKVVAPPKTKAKAETAEVILIPRPNLNEELRGQSPEAVGGIDLRRGRFEALLSMPSDALSSVLSLPGAFGLSICMENTCAMDAAK